MFIRLFLFHTDPPGPPIDLSIIKVGQNFVDLEWLPPVRDGGSKITKYIIKKKEKDEWAKVMTAEAYDTTCRLKDLKDNVLYHFAIFAENKVGISDACEAKPVKPAKEIGKYFCFYFCLYKKNFRIYYEYSFPIMKGLL